MRKKIKLDAFSHHIPKYAPNGSENCEKNETLLALEESVDEFLYNLVGKVFLTITKNPDVINLTLIYLATQKQTFA